MQHEFPFQFQNPEAEALTPEEQYRKHIGQHPPAHYTEHQIREALTDPDRERSAILAANRAEDVLDARSHYPKKK